MKVTIRDAARPDTILREWAVMPHLGLPHVGARILLPRAQYQPRQQTLRVVDYIWDLSPDDGGDIEVRMLVTAD